MLTVENLEAVFTKVCEATKDKLSESQCISRYNTLSDMLAEFEMSVEEVQEGAYITFDVVGIKSPFIVAYYAKESFIFLTTNDEDSMEKFISDVTAK